MSERNHGALVRLVAEVRACTICAKHLPQGPRPVVQIASSARILVAGQAPGRRVHETGLPFNDASGERLRAWLGVDRATFYDAKRIAILPMGFCYPGTGAGGDLPPRPECAPRWRSPLLAHLPNLELTLAIGRFAVGWHLPQEKGPLAPIVAGWKRHWPNIVPMPHPSPRNQRWFSQHPWFESEVVPALRRRIAKILGASRP